MTDEITTDGFVDSYLAHYGKKGMKWGIRNFSRAVGKEVKKEVKKEVLRQKVDPTDPKAIQFMTRVTQSKASVILSNIGLADTVYKASKKLLNTLSDDVI